MGGLNYRKLENEHKLKFKDHLKLDMKGAYGWNSPGRESLLDECYQKVCTLGLLTRSVLIKIACFFLRLVRNCHGENDIKKYQLEGVPKKSKFSVKNLLLFRV